MNIQGYQTLLTNTAANQIVFHGTAAFSSNEDCSITALFRAIIIDNEPFESLEKLRLLTSTEYRIVNPAQIQNSILGLPSTEWPIALTICMTASTDVFDNLNPHSDWETFDNAPIHLNQFLSQYRKTKVYINRETHKIVVVAVGSYDEKWAQALCCMLWVCMPWYYPDRKKEVVDFFRQMSVFDEAGGFQAEEVIIGYAARMAEKLNIRDLCLHAAFDGLGDQLRKNRLETWKDKLHSIEREIDNLRSDLSQSYAKFDEFVMQINALETQEPAKDDRMFEFFRDHKNIVVHERQGLSIDYSVVDVLDFYDDEEAKVLFENQHAWLHENFKRQLDTLRALFVDHLGLIRVSADFWLDDSRLVIPRSNSLQIRETMPNPHIYFYGCSGGNDEYYTEYAKNGDWDLGVEQSISATKNWAVGDSVVGKSMMRWLIGNDERKCIYVNEDFTPIRQVTENCKLVNFKTFEEMCKQKAEKEGTNE